MVINFQRVYAKEQSLGDLASQCSTADLGNALNSYVDSTIRIISSVSDEQVVYIPHDPDANDLYATTDAERHVGWSLVHLVMHVMASAEEAAAFSSILARGITIGGRLHSERDWRQVTTCAEMVARLEECRRMCLTYLATWPDPPDLATQRIMPENLSRMKPNAPISFLAGLMHWHRHLEQFQKVAAEVCSGACYAACQADGNHR
jgi:hypothetical protein